jgi:uncharacterized protein YecE (DUF72 family)
MTQRIKRIVVKADKILVYFNNHARGQAVKNAATLAKMLLENEKKQPSDLRSDDLRSDGLQTDNLLSDGE